MNCERFQMVVNDLTRDQQFVVMGEMGIGIDRDERARALEHAVECDACGLIWEAERSLTTGLRNLAVEMNSLVAPPQLEAKVLAAFRERSNGGQGGGEVGKDDGKATVRAFRPRRPERQLPRYWVAAIAAVLLVVFAIVVVRSGVLWRSKPQLAMDEAPKENVLPDVQPPQRNTPSAVAPNDLVPPAPAHHPNYQVASHRFRGRYAARAISASLGDFSSAEGNTEITTDFFPISYGNTPNLQEGGQLMRVELPRAAVARFGLPVNMERGNETVKADVLVGADGLAQAIRFVH